MTTLELMNIQTVTEVAGMYTNCAPDHPLVHIVNLAETQVDERFLRRKICTNLYGLIMKKGECAKIRYGRNHYDFSSGVLTAYGPGQVVQIYEAYGLGDLQGWALYFHPDLLLQHPLSEAIKHYGYFSYDVCEALHLSEREQEHLNQVVHELGRELQQNLDDFSLDIILASLDLLLKYTDRYFNRQFLTRRPFQKGHVGRFLHRLELRMDDQTTEQEGLPTVSQLATDMNMSANYMSDLLRKETGKSAQELIHQQLLEKAKYLLLNTDDSVASIAYRLGFEYPQYFSRLFKQKISLSPQEFRKLH